METGITPTGIETLDQMIGGGLKKGQIGFVCTQAGVGRTTFLCKAVYGAAMAGKKALFVSLSESEKTVNNKFRSLISGVPLNKLHENEDLLKEKLIKLYAKSNNFGHGKIKSFDKATIKDIENYIQAEFPDIDLLIIDDLYLVDIEKSDLNYDWHANKKWYQELSDLAENFSIPVWTGMQLTHRIHEENGTYDVKNFMNMGRNDVGVIITKTPEQRELGEATYTVFTGDDLNTTVQADGVLNCNTMEVEIYNTKQKLIYGN